MADSTPLVPAPRLDELIAAVRTAQPDALGQLSNAVMVAQHLGETADALIGHFVDQARRSGASWTDIGASMGVSKQAAQQRFVPKVPASADEPDAFSRFTPRARNVIVAAHNAAREAHHAEVDTAHLVLGLLTEPAAIAAKVLVGEGAAMDTVAAAARASLPTGSDDSPELVPYSARARDVLALTLSEALRLGHNYVGTEHILLALLEHEHTEAGVLRGLGVTKPAAEKAVAAALGSLST
ncbi:MAG: Clp protease N-terminal domain-containing protein [Actinomycetota bacterium]|nr:Clp protease N-terminal domain-containing protein [Actinomycetota bacterium]